MNLIDRVKNIIVTPNTEWDVINKEEADAGKIVMGYVVPLAGAAAIAAFIGYAFVGFNVSVFKVKGMDWGLYQALVVFIGAIISVYVTSTVIDMLAPNFNSQKNFGRSMQLVAYSSTPAWIGGLLAIIPSIAFLGALFGLYGLYLMYIGLPKLKNTPEDKHVSYFVISLVVTIIVYIIIGYLLSRLLLNLFGLGYDAFNTSIF